MASSTKARGSHDIRSGALGRAPQRWARPGMALSGPHGACVDWATGSEAKG